MIRAVVTDIEGTTSSLAFVKDVLFPYSRNHLADFVRAHVGRGDVSAILANVWAEANLTIGDTEAAIACLLCWSDEDKKITPLKALQGLIWEAGYAEGAFCGHIYPDAEGRLREWAAGGVKLYVYSSGSVHAQKLLFGHTKYGDLTPLFSGFFDTRIGAKADRGSYATIAREAGLEPPEILFLSDIGAELDAARAAGMQTCQLLRPGNTPAPGHPQAADFDAVPLPT
ncbi:MAG: acireductone synthase [Nitrospirota bacterium]|nr:acireductone synthase [Nitrospirota bacterium]